MHLKTRGLAILQLLRYLIANRTGTTKDNKLLDLDTQTYFCVSISHVEISYNKLSMSVDFDMFAYLIIIIFGSCREWAWLFINILLWFKKIKKKRLDFHILFALCNFKIDLSFTKNLKSIASVLLQTLNVEEFWQCVPRLSRFQEVD